MVLAQKIGDAFERLAFYQALLNLESPLVGKAFADLVRQTDVQWERLCEHAWRHAPPVSDYEFQVSDWEQYHFDNELERETCLLAMRRDLQLTSILLRRAELDVLYLACPEAEPTVGEPLPLGA